MKMRQILESLKYKKYPELEEDLKDVFQNFGGPAGRGQGNTFNNHLAFKRLGENIPFKNPKLIFRGLSLETGLTVDDELINKCKSGIRSWTKYKSIGIKYTWSGIHNPTRILLIAENPKCLLSGDSVNLVGNEIIGRDVLDEGEFIFDAKNLNIISHERIEDRRDFYLNIVKLG